MPAEKLLAVPTVWMSYDLGIEGDYEGLFAWLASHNARECGEALAHFPYPFRQNLLRELAADLKRKVKLGRRSRVYLIYKDELGLLRGKFVVGSRRRPPWAGYATDDQTEDDVSVEDVKQSPPRRASGIHGR